MLKITTQSSLRFKLTSTVDAGAGTNIGFIRRYEDKRSVEDKLYKFRYVIPKEANNSRDPVNGFIIQNSSLTGFAKTGDPSATTISLDDNNFRRNHQFISSISETSSVVTVRTELPHKVLVGDVIFVENVQDSNNTGGLDGKGYNGFFTVTGIIDAYQFTYANTDIDGVERNTGNYVDTTNNRNLFLPRFSINDNKKNFSVYRSTVVEPYIRGEE